MPTEPRADDPAALVAECRAHRQHICAKRRNVPCVPLCIEDGQKWPCLTARLADALEASERQLALAIRLHQVERDAAREPGGCPACSCPDCDRRNRAVLTTQKEPA